ncbi:MAG: biotin-dependent carboxyltransferase family protein [Hyphomonas sp.]|nr:biotin-dependent carboxyltransferase family protein [Hyphomonas sp.]
MSLVVLDPGIQSTVQAAPRLRFRQAGVPSSGPADPVSMALADRLVGKPADAACLEITYGPAAFRFEAPVQIALTGAVGRIHLGGAECPMHATLDAKAGDTLQIAAAGTGARIYLAVSGVLHADAFLGSGSTYLPAGLGGHEGRALRKGDRLIVTPAAPVPAIETPEQIRLPPAASYALRAVPGPDFSGAADIFATSVYRVSQRSSRMGAEIEGTFPPHERAGLLPSSAVFPGALQVTPQGRGFLLLADGQTTGGYPHVLQVIRADRHLLGQLRPGDSIRFLLRTQLEAEAALRAKQALLQAWMPDFRL